MEDIKRTIDGSKHQRIITKNILDQIFQNVTWARSDGIEILDVGCGPGVVTKDILVPKLPGNFKEVIGMDKREDYITYANNTYKDEKVNFITMDIEEGVPPEYKQRFDLVTSFQCLQQLRDQELALNLMQICVRPGGHFILTFEFRKEYDDFMYGMSENSKWAPYIDKCLPPEMLDDEREAFITTIRGCGFRIIHGELLKCELPKSKMGYIAYLKRVDPFAKKMTPSEQKKYFHHVEEHHVNKNLSPEDPNTFISKYTAMVVHAIKE